MTYGQPSCRRLIAAGAGDAYLPVGQGGRRRHAGELPAAADLDSEDLPSGGLDDHSAVRWNRSVACRSDVR